MSDVATDILTGVAQMAVFFLVLYFVGGGFLAAVGKFIWWLHGWWLHRSRREQPISAPTDTSPPPASV